MQDIRRPMHPAEAVRSYLENLEKGREQVLWEVNAAREEIAQAQERLDRALKAQAEHDTAMVTWRNFQRQHCE